LLDLLDQPRVRGYWGRSLRAPRDDFAVGSFAGKIRMRTAGGETHPNDVAFTTFWNTLLE
jgi:hypothetical protein